MFPGWVPGLAFDHSNGSYLVASAIGGTVPVSDKHSGECTNLYEIDPISRLGRVAAEIFMISPLKHA